MKLACALVAATVAANAACAGAQELPQKPVRLLVPSVAGGPSDFAARLIAAKLCGSLVIQRARYVSKRLRSPRSTSGYERSRLACACASADTCSCT